jgi:23S rRNA (cytidine1920-2'-O)/16S rRNA (cytidine1409-2'-O)-methyltransferase
MRERLDKVIKQRRLIRSRSRAQRVIEAGRVTVDGQVITRPGHPIDPEAQIEILSRERYVSRGGQKLEAALDRFRLDPKDRVCLDIGASTGGFTDCLLQRGAAKVIAIDVGHGQLHPKLRDDPRVVAHEGLNARYLEPQDVGEPVELVTIDVSFISLKLVLPPLVEIVAGPGALPCDLILLVKPQFEVGKDRLPADGVVKRETDRAAVLDDLRTFIKSQTPWRILEAIDSPVPGEKGNVEYLLHVR